jgi:anti-sigma regulatory factor (Ser/Thr protein kinase)
MKEQTAVEWLHEIAKQREPDKFDWKQAKAMEKEQIENAFNYGQLDLGMEADEYYNKIFNK